MRHLCRSCCVALVFALMSCASMPPAPAPVESGLREGRLFDAPERLSVPVPEGWSGRRAEDGHAVLTAPEGDLFIHVGAFDAPSFEAAQEAAWAAWAPEVPCEREAPREAPAPEGVEEMQVGPCKLDPAKPFGQLIGQRAQGAWHVLLLHGALGTLQRRNAQAVTVISGLEIQGVERTSLKGQAPRPWDDEMRAELRSFIEAQQRALELPGLSVAVVSREGVVLEEGFGVVKQGEATAVTPETLMMIGSTTKPLTVLMLGSLVQEGKARWEQPVVELMPGFHLADPEATQAIQLKHMVCACTGVPRRDMELLFNADASSPRQLLDSLGSYALYTRFGETFQYSNQMVAAGGYLGAAALGASLEELGPRYREAMQARVFGPLGMTSTTLDWEAALAAPQRATPHAVAPDGGWAAFDPRDERIVLPVAPAGGVWSTARDMGRLAQVLLRGGSDTAGQAVIAPATLQAMWTPQVQVDADTSYGLGWFLSEHQGLQVIHHGGNNLGFTSELAVLPEADLAVVVLMNTQGSNSLGRAIWQRALELRYGLPSRGAEKLALFKANKLKNTQEGLAKTHEPAPGELEPWLGAWEHPALGVLQLRQEGGGVRMQSSVLGARVRVQSSSSGEVEGLMMAEGPLLGMPWRLGRDAEGKPTLQLGLGADVYSLTRRLQP